MELNKKKTAIRRCLCVFAWTAISLHATFVLAEDKSSTLPSFDRCTVQKIDQLAAQLMKQNQIPGMAVGVVRKHQIVYRKGFGVTNIDAPTPVTPDTVFQLGSESKMMVGTAIMQLQVQGKIDLDKPLVDYLPYFHLPDARYKKITIRQLLSHRSGLPYCLDKKSCESQDYLTPEFDVSALERHVRNASAEKDKAVLLNEPGVQMQYSDFGFEMLGDVIAKLSGESFESYIKKYIFLPTGMTRSSFLLQDIHRKNMATPHVLDPTLKVNNYFPYTRQHAPSSHLFSSVNDMSRFVMMQMNYGQIDGVRVLPASAYDLMWSPEIKTNMPSPWEKFLGLGWFLGEVDGHPIRGHAGGDIGFAGETMIAPDEGVAVVAMVNREFWVEEFSTQVMRWLLEPAAHGYCVTTPSETTH